MELGSIKLTWTILRELNGATLYLCNRIVGKMQFETKLSGLASGDEAWKQSNIREWLNDEFLNKHFTDEEKNRLVKHNDTGDKVFLLSSEEYGNGGDVINAKETWWLRPSGDSAAPPFVDTLGYAKRHYSGYFTHGIRPAILVRD